MHCAHLSQFLFAGFLSCLLPWLLDIRRWPLRKYWFDPPLEKEEDFWRDRRVFMCSFAHLSKSFPKSRGVASEKVSGSFTRMASSHLKSCSTCPQKWWQMHSIVVSGLAVLSLQHQLGVSAPLRADSTNRLATSRIFDCKFSSVSLACLGNLDLMVRSSLGT